MRDTRCQALLALAAGLLLVLPAVQAPPAPADDPVVNGQFELFVPEAVYGPLEGSPVDECIGIGHQVFYGSETWQQRVEDAAVAASEGDAQGAQDNASAAADMWTSEPPNGTVRQATFLAGYGHCVFSSQEGYDVVWLNPLNALRKPAIHWSFQDDNTGFGDFEGDREARIGANLSASTHNLWQAWPSPHQAYSGSFDHLSLRVEHGQVPSSAVIQLSFSATPLESQHHWVLLFLDCQLTFRAGQLLPGENGVIQADPTQAHFRSRYKTCDPAEEDWNNAETPEERRLILGRLRIVQLSFWNFNRGADDVIFDGIGLKGTTTAAEEAAARNLNPNPCPPPC